MVCSARSTWTLTTANWNQVRTRLNNLGYTGTDSQMIAAFRSRNNISETGTLRGGSATYNRLFANNATRALRTDGNQVQLRNNDPFASQPQWSPSGVMAAPPQSQPTQARPPTPTTPQNNRPTTNQQNSGIAQALTPHYEPPVTIRVNNQAIRIPIPLYNDMNGLRTRQLSISSSDTIIINKIGNLVTILVHAIAFTQANFVRIAGEVSTIFRMTTPVVGEFFNQLRSAAGIFNFDAFTRRPVTGSHGGVYWLFCRTTGEFDREATAAYTRHQFEQIQIATGSSPSSMVHIPSAFVAIHRRRLNTGIYEVTGEPLTPLQRIHSRAYIIADGWIAITPAVRTGMIAYTVTNAHKVGGGQGNTSVNQNNERVITLSNGQRIRITSPTTAVSYHGNISNANVQHFTLVNGVWTATMRIPQGLTDAQFSEMSALLRDRVGHISNDIRIQGSRAGGTARPNSDIDIAVRVNQSTFDRLIREGFKTPNPGSSRERTMLHAINVGKITSGDAGLRSVRVDLARLLGMDVDISIILINGMFDTPPYIPIR